MRKNNIFANLKYTINILIKIITMRKLSFLLSAVLMLQLSMVRADEGMWLLMLLKDQNISEMQKKD